MKIFDESSEVTKEMWDSDLICIWPLHTPPTNEDLERINFVHEMTGRRLTRDEVLNLIVPRGRT